MSSLPQNMMSPEVARAAAQSMLAAQNGGAAPMSNPQMQAQQAAQAQLAPAPAPVPLPAHQDTQAQLQSANDKKEAELEVRLRAQDEQDAQGIGPLPPPPELGQMVADPSNPDEVVSPEGIVARSAENTADTEKALASSASRSKANELDKAKTETAAAADSEVVNQKLQTEIQARQQHLLGVQAQVEQEQQAQIDNYKSVNAEMMKMASAAPKDIYGAAGMNSILGRVAVMIGGAGVNGFHENRAMQQIMQSAEANVAQERARFERLDKVGQGARTIYGMLNSKLSNAYEVDSTLKNMALETYKQQLLSVANKYAGQTAKQAAQGAIAKIDAEQATLANNVEQHHIENAKTAIQLHAQENATQVAAYAAQLKAQGVQQKRAGDIVPVEGFVGGVPKAEHARMAKLVGGSRVLVDGLNHMATMAKHGATPAQIRDYFVTNAVLFKGARDFLETGTRIEAGEQTVISSLTTNDAESMFNMLTGGNFDAADMAAKLNASKRAVVAATYQQVKAAAPRTAALDSKDPLFGPYNPRTYKGDATSGFEQRTRAYLGTARGRTLIERAPAYVGG